MKKTTRTILFILAGIVAAGFVYWQFIKKKVVKNTIEKTIAKKTDSLYFIHYDSSRIDEISGSASFYNVVLQSDSAQKVLLNSTDSLPNALFNIRVKQVTATGVNIPGLLQQQNIAAAQIVLLRPVVQIINTGADNPKPFTMKDTLALYQKILGKFRSIRAGVIQVTNGQVVFTDRAGRPKTTLNDINITLNKFTVDSTHDYQNIISYFIKDVHASVARIELPAAKNKTRLTIEMMDYDAAKRSLQINAIRQHLASDNKLVTELKNIRVNELNTDEFIVRQHLDAGSINCDGGLLTIYTNPDKKTGAKKDQTLELSTSIIDQAQVGSISLGNTKLVIVDPAKPEAEPFVLNNARFKVLKMLQVKGGASLANLINDAQWQFSADGFSIHSKDKIYKLSVGSFMIDNVQSLVKVKSVSFKPVVSEAQYVKQSRFQHDLYDFTFNDIVLSGINVKRFIEEKAVEAEQASLQPILKIFNDRGLPAEKESKVGNYPQQQVLKLPFPVYLRTVKMTNALVSYREKALQSRMTGNVFFSGINAVLSNVTNIPERIKANPVMKLSATARFLGKGGLSTEWVFPLDAKDGAFNISGQLFNMEAVDLNPIIEPLAMASVKKGKIDQVNFNIDGTDTKAKGNVLFLYRDLHMDMLKKGADSSLEKKSFMSFLANVLIKNNSTDRSKKQPVEYDRDVSRSFFNLVWKTIFTGAKKVAK